MPIRSVGSSPRSSKGGSECILLLEDETSLRDSIQRVLVRLGYTVEAYADLATARAAIAETRFDLIVCDVRLPDGTGTQLVAEALERDGSIGTILMSGYASSNRDPELKRLTGTSFLHKPFALAELLDQVNTQLGDHS